MSDMNASLRLLALVFAVFALAGCSRLAPLENPGQIAVNSPDPQWARHAILSALPRRGWVAEGEWPGIIVARLDIRSHRARVRIDYDASTVRISYVDSVNLKFAVDSNGVPYIHRNYNLWVRNLASDIALATNGQPMVVAY